MLNLEYRAANAAIPRDVSGTGISLSRGERAARSGRAVFQLERLPLLRAQRVEPDSGAPAGILPASAWQHGTTSNFTTMTRLAVAKGDYTGSHPVRDPV